MAASAHTFRDEVPKTGWAIAAMKIFVWGHAKANHTRKRIEELEDMFRVGALDKELVHHALQKDPTFLPSMITWVNKPNTEATPGSLHAATGKKQVELQGLQFQSCQAQLNEPHRSQINTSI